MIVDNTLCTGCKQCERICPNFFLHLIISSVLLCYRINTFRVIKKLI
ncbi:MAG: 4Fe-4S binding protein [Spirochaetota bacterium]